MHNVPPSVPQPPFDGEGEKERQSGYGASGHEQRFEDVCADVGDVRDATILRDILWSALRKPCYEHSEQRACAQLSACTLLVLAKAAYRTIPPHQTAGSRHRANAGALVAFFVDFPVSCACVRSGGEGVVGRVVTERWPVEAGRTWRDVSRRQPSRIRFVWDRHASPSIEERLRRDVTCSRAVAHRMPLCDRV